MSEIDDRTDLLWQRVVRIPRGGWRGGELEHGGHVLGWAERGVVSGNDGRTIAQLRRERRGDDGIRVYVVEDAQGDEVGSIVPATRVNWRGKTKPITGGAPDEWAGSIRLRGSSEEIATVRSGDVYHADGRLAAQLMIEEKQWMSTQSLGGAWTLRFRDCDDERLRVMCFGWMNLAWDLQRALDTRD